MSTSDEQNAPRPGQKPGPCNVCGHLHPLNEVAVHDKTFRLCDECATKVVSDIQRTLIPAMR